MLAGASKGPRSGVVKTLRGPLFLVYFYYMEKGGTQMEAASLALMGIAVIIQALALYNDWRRK